MSRLRWTRLAVQDLEAISLYIESKSTLATANRVVRTIYDAVQGLRRSPGMGRPGLVEGTRELVVTNFPAYLVVYRSASDEVIEVLRIWHGAQQR